MEDFIPTYSSQTSLYVATDPKTGTPVSGTRLSPVSFKGLHTKATPLLWEVLATGESCAIEHQLFRTAATGGRELLTTNKFEGCVITSLELVTPDTSDEDLDTVDNYVNVTFTYSKIDSTHETGSTAFTFDSRDKSEA
jgi:type VI secretion system secreted protein Hcp